MAKNATGKNFRAPSIQTTPTGVPDGKVVDFLTGRFFRDTPEEYVRQNIEKALVRQYRYDPATRCPNCPLKLARPERASMS
jgi:type I restriction enzyme M protein